MVSDFGRPPLFLGGGASGRGDASATSSVMAKRSRTSVDAPVIVAADPPLLGKQKNPHRPVAQPEQIAGSQGAKKVDRAPLPNHSCSRNFIFARSK